MPQRTGKRMTDRDGYTPAMRRRLAKLDEEIAQSQAEARKADAEARRATAEARRYEAAYQKAREEDAKASAKLQKTMENVSKQWGDFGRSEGEMVEEEFVSALHEKKAIGDFKLREVLSRLKNRYEYDLVCINGRAVFVGEVKRQLTARDVRDFADNRLPHFAEDFPAHARRRTVHGMVGGVRVNPAAEREAKARRLVLLRLKNRALLAENLPRRAA